MTVIASRPSWWGAAAAMLGVLVLSALSGAVIGLGSTQLSLLAIGGVVGAMMLFVPTSVILAALLVLAFVGVGVGMYYAGIGQMHWVPYALCLFLWIKLLLDRFSVPMPAASRMTPGFIWALYLYFLIAIIATLLADIPLINWLVGGKNTIFVWSVTLLVASAAVSERFLRITCLALLAAAALQAPFALTQHFGAFSLSGNWDAVVGTFGGDPEGGGGSGLMAVFLSIAIGWAVLLIRDRILHPIVGTGVIVASGLAIVMAETKVFFLLCPMMLLLVLGRDLLHRPAFALGVLVAGAAVLSAMALYYKETYFAGRVDRGAATASFSDYANYILRTDSKVDFVNRWTGEVSRAGAPLMWLNYGGFDGPQGYVVGSGMTATRASQTIGYGKAARRFSFTLATSTLSVLLWEVGVLGLLAFLAVLTGGALRAFALSQDAQVPPFHRTMLLGMGAALVVMLATVPYNNALVDGPALQVLLAFCVGYVLRWHRHAMAVTVRST